MDNSAALTEMVRYTERQLKKAQDKQATELAYTTDLVAQITARLAQGNPTHSMAANLARSAQSLQANALRIETYQDQLDQFKEMAEGL